MTSYLGIDFGTKRIGLALAVSGLAEPLMILENAPGVEETIMQICQEHQISVIVLGVSENSMAIKTHVFGDVLAKKVGIPITYVDETLSSYDVHQDLVTAPKKKRSGHIDHYAAAKILQEYLEDRPA